MAASGLPRRKQGLTAAAAALAAVTALAAALSHAVAQDAKMVAYGQHLARECTSCHRLDGINNGIPSIVGWQTDTFVATLKFYRDGARTNPVMVSVASSLSDEQMQALATYFASMPKHAKPAPATKPK